MKPFIDYVLDLHEDVPANAVAGGQVAGVAVGPQGEPPGLSAVMRKLKMTKRKSPVAVADETK